MLLIEKMTDHEEQKIDTIKDAIKNVIKKSMAVDGKQRSHED